MARLFKQIIDMGGRRIVNVGTPTTSTDAATKGYADSVGGGGGGGVVVQRHEFSNADVTIDPADTILAQTGTMTGAHTATLPDADAVDAGTQILIIDESGTFSDTTNLLVHASATSGQMLKPGLFNIVTSMVGPYSWMIVVSNGVDTWHWYDAYNTSHPGVTYTELVPHDGIHFDTFGGQLFISSDNATHTAVRETDIALTSTSTITVNDPQLIVPLLANSTYLLDAFIIYNTPVLDDMRFGWNVPTLATGWWESDNAIIRGVKDHTGTLAVTGTATNVSTHAFGWFFTSTTAGNFGFRACKNTNVDTANGVSILAGSRITMTRLGIADGA